MRVIHQEIDSADGRWRLALGAPSADMVYAIKGYFESAGELFHRREKVLPVGDVVLIFNLGAPHWLLDREDLSPVAEHKRAWLSGLQERHLVIESPRFAATCGVRLWPSAAARVVGASAAELSNSVIPLAAIMGDRVSELYFRLNEAARADERFALIENFVRERLNGAADPNATTEWIWRRLLESGGNLRVGDLAADVGWSRKHLRARVIEEFGMSPKRMARLLRFQNALVRANGGHVDWAEIAQDCGYYDQAHFYRDFRAFAGEGPSQYLKSRLEGSEYGFTRLDEDAL